VIRGKKSRSIGRPCWECRKRGSIAYREFQSSHEKRRHRSKGGESGRPPAMLVKGAKTVYNRALTCLKPQRGKGGGFANREKEKDRHNCAKAKKITSQNSDVMIKEKRSFPRVEEEGKKGCAQEKRAK